MPPTAPIRLSEAQARAILDLRLQRLTGLERDKIADELEELSAKIKDYLEILGSRPRRLDILRAELREVKEQFATPRRTEIQDLEFEQDIEDLIQREDMVVTVTHGGYIKRVPLSTYRAQRRGGKGRAGMATREEDFVSQLFVANTHTPVLFFSTSGHGLQAQGLPPAAGHAAGARQGAGQPAAARRGRDHLRRHAAAGGRGEAGTRSTSCSPPPPATCGATSSPTSST